MKTDQGSKQQEVGEDELGEIKIDVPLSSWPPSLEISMFFYARKLCKVLVHFGANFYICSGL